MPRQYSKPGLARVVETPAELDYLTAQFLGDLPPVVPRVLTSKLRHEAVRGLQNDS